MVIGLSAVHFFSIGGAASKDGSSSLALIGTSIGATYCGGGSPIILSMHALMEYSIILCEFRAFLINLLRDALCLNALSLPNKFCIQEDSSKLHSGTE